MDMERLAVPGVEMKTPYFDQETTKFISGVVEEVPIVGLHTPDEETWVIPLSIFVGLMEVYMEAYAPGEEEHYQ